MSRQNKETIEDEINLSNDLSALSYIADSDDNPTRLRSRLLTPFGIRAHIPVSLFSNLDNESALTTREALALKQVAITRRKTVLANHILRQIDALDVEVIYALAGSDPEAPTNYRDIRDLLGTHPTLLDRETIHLEEHNDDETLLTKTAIDAIRLAAIRRRTLIIKEEIESTIQRMTAANLEQLNVFLNGLDDDPAHIRTAIEANRAHFGNRSVIARVNDDSLLADGPAQAIRLLAIAKRKELIASKLDMTLQGMNHQDQRALLTEFTNPMATDDTIRAHINANKAAFGLPASTPDLDNHLLDKTTITALKPIAVKKLNSLTVKEAIQALDFADIAIARELSLAPTPDNVRIILARNQPQLGVLLVATPLVTNEDAESIQKLASQQTNALTIKNSIGTLNDQVILRGLNAATTHTEICTAVQAHSASLGITAVIPPDELLTIEQAQAVKQAAMTRLADLLRIEQGPREVEVLAAIAGVNNPAHLVNMVAAAGEPAIRAALHADWTNLGLLNPVADDAVDTLLTNQQTTRVQREAVSKIQTLNLQIIKTAIAALIDITDPTLDAIVDIDTRAGGDIIRGVLTTHRANLGNIDVSTNVLLTDAAAKEIRTTAIQQFNTLLIKKTVNDYVASDPSVFERVAKASYGDASAIRDAIRACKRDFGGNALVSTKPHSSDFLSDAQAIEIQTLVIQKYNALIIKRTLATITYSNSLDDVVAAPANDADAIRKALNLDKAYFGNVDLSRGQPALSDEEAKAIHALAVQKHAALVAKPIQRANALMEKQDSLLHFTEEKVKAGESAAKPLTRTPGIAASQTKPGVTIYEGQYLDKEHKIVSRRTFDVPSSATAPATTVVGILEQDHKGKVTDVTEEPGRLKESDRALLALKQAQMLLTNYTPGSGDIIINGTDVAQANKLYAALLYLKDKNPHLSAIKIKSFVYGCNGPSGWIKSQATSAFIKEHLKSLPKNLLEFVKQQTTLIVPAVIAIHTETARKQEELDAMRKAGGNPTALIKAKMADLQQAELQEGKEISTGGGGHYKKS